MPINSFLYPGAKVTLGYEVANSLRFNDGDSAYLNFTPSSTGSRRIFTISFWFKQTNSGATRALFSTGNYSGGDGFLQINLSSSGRLVVDDYDQGGSSYNLRWVTPTTGPLFRDPAAWYHFVLAVDSTQGTQSNRVKVYINGVDISSDFTQTTNTSQNDDFHVNTSSKVQQIGRSQNNNNYYDGYLAEFVMIDGSQLTPTSFGEFDEDSPTIWKPKDVSGLTFGTNGFYLDFENSSALGNDVSGNDNDFTANNLAATDQSTDTCTNNFCTLNPLDRSTLSSDGTTFAEGNLKTTDGSSNYLVATGTMAVTQGKWYFEVKIDATASHTASGVKIVDLDGWDRTDGSANGSYGWLYAANGDKRNGGSSSSYGDAFSANDIIGVAIDMDNKAVYFSRNGTFQASGDPTSGASKTNAAFTNLTGTITAQVYDGSSGQAHEFSMNFGSPPYSISSGNSDANGYGNFEYSVPSGYYSINSKNLAEFG